jgi:hypothetical protein
MQTSTKWVVGVLVFLAVSVVAVGLGVLAFFVPVRVDTDSGQGGPTPVVEPPVAPIPDGEWFALVTVGEDETGHVTLGIDLAEMLSGQAAHDAAVDAGVIDDDEELPNDFFIDNPESVLELVHLVDAVTITVLSGDNPATGRIIDVDELVALYEGSYEGPAVYGIAPHQPIAMDVTITDGLVASASAVYLP